MSHLWDGPALGSRPRPDHAGQHRRDGPAPRARPRATSRAAWLYPLLARGASQHARHRQRGDRGRHRATWPPAPRPSGSARAASCCRITRRSSIAEQFGTLESLFPGRIDLGLGRAPGTDPATARALRRTLQSDPDDFPQDVARADGVSRAGGRADGPRGSGRRACASRSDILGSSLFGAQVAAALGLPFAFASHFAPRR